MSKIELSNIYVDEKTIDSEDRVIKIEILENTLSDFKIIIIGGKK